ncbi:protein of unknown function [Sterolibacterium denitrificans]|uniref:Uncharacterized protein n=1 Tax=Sterolibacterium denitrificans TaxID=157592 RepID=A0A7Z7MW21_9PROT|nr:protein of unknown function [Sterolibacterium denitrificans]
MLEHDAPHRDVVWASDYNHPLSHFRQMDFGHEGKWPAAGMILPAWPHRLLSWSHPHHEPFR